MGKAAIPYYRVSGEEQAKKGYSLPDQGATARSWCEQEGYTVLEEISDEGWSGAYLERPGLDRVRDLVAAGGVDVVVVLARDRLARGVQAGLLAEEFREHGTRLVSLNAQIDDSPEGELQGGLLDLFAAYERSVIRRRTQRRLHRSVKQGNIIRGPKAPYGFRLTEDKKGLLVDGEEMKVVGGIFRDMAAGSSLGEVMRQLTADGIPRPSGGIRWNRQTVRAVVNSDLYRPHEAHQIIERIEEPVAAALQEGRDYGLWHFNQRATRKWSERDGDQYVTRYSVQMREREEWLAVPVDITNAGLSAATVDRAREVAKNRYNKPSTAAGRFWQVRGIVHCAECGSILSPNSVTGTRADGRKVRTPYYRCGRRYNSGAKDCDHRRSYPAAKLEALIWQGAEALLWNKHKLREAYEQEIDRRKKSFRGDPDKEANTLLERLQKLETRENGFYDLAADGLLDREKLREKLAEVSRQRAEIEEALKSARNRKDSVEELRRACCMVWDSFESLRSGELHYLKPEGRHKMYQALDLRAEVGKDGTVTLRGIFPQQLNLSDLVQEHLDRSTKQEAETPEGLRLVATPFVTSSANT